MEQFTRYAGGWSAYHCGYSYVSLNWACWRMEVKHKGASHRALADTERALSVLQAMAVLHGKIDVLEPPKVEEVFIDDGLGVVCRIIWLWHAFGDARLFLSI